MPLWEMLPDIFKRKPNTIKFKKKIRKDSKMYTYKTEIKQSLAKSLSMREAVKLKPDVSEDEWIAMNTIEAYNTLILVWGFVSDFCTANSCPVMCAGEKYQYLWAESKKDKPVKLDAPAYVEKLFEWIAAQIDDPKIFPEQGEFSKKFRPVVRKIITRMFRVYAHIYREHLDKIKELNAKEHVDKCFRHLYYFIDEFKLVKDIEFVPIQSWIDQLKN
jgi:MOB kinase activator 1